MNTMNNFFIVMQSLFGAVGMLIFLFSVYCGAVGVSSYYCLMVYRLLSKKKGMCSCCGRDT